MFPTQNVFRAPDEVKVVSGFQLGSIVVPVSDTDQQVVRALFEGRNKVVAIKFLREHYCIGLREAKLIAEYIARDVVAIQDPRRDLCDSFAMRA